MVLEYEILIKFHKDIPANIFFQCQLSQQQKPIAYLFPFNNLLFLNLCQPLIVSQLIIEYLINQCHFDSNPLLQRTDLSHSYYLIVNIYIIKDHLDGVEIYPKLALSQVI